MSRFSRFSKQPQSSSSAVPSNSQKGTQKTQVRDYFDEDDDEDDQIHASKPNLNDGDDDYDPLDAFMDNINQQVAKEKEITQTKPVSLPEIVSYGDHDSGFGEDDIDDLEDTEANARFIASDDEEEEVGGDRRSLNESMKNPKGKLIEPLPRVDHSQIQYKPFKKRFYSESNELKSLSSEEISQLRKELELTVTPSSSQIHCPSPVKTFRQCGFPIQLLKEIENQGYEKPTAIQAQSIPIILSGNDLLALAKTGSGKTLAYVWPMLIHILDQPQMKIGDGPIALVLVPTRELANQIFVEVKKYAKLFQIRFTVIYGGAGKYEMSKSLKESPEIVIATPGRLIEMIKMKATNLLRLTYIALDEADRMFEMGFEYQIRSILYNIQPSKQLLMFSATMKKRIENFAREVFTNNNEVRVVVGMIGQANADIQQLTHIVPDVNEKWLWLASEIDEFAANGKVLIFVLSKSDTEELTYKLREFFQRRQLDIQVDCIHGDKDQSERSKIMNRFAKKSLLATSEGGGGGSKEELTILVATDIASRGLDVKDIRTVINYDVAKNIETYVHRIGRTGRMGVEGVTPGTAYTLLTPKDSSFAVDLVQNLRLSGQPIAEDLIHLAMKDSKWNKIRHFHHQGGLGSGAGRFSSAPRHQGMGGSLSSFAGVNRAMTSEMMANSTQQAMQINLPQGLMQAYQEKIESRNMSTCEEEPKRKSRFSAAPAATQPIAVSNQPLTGFVVSSLSSNPSTLHQSSNPSNPNNPLMKGFVKASSTYSSVSTASTNSSTNQQEQARKKTRWG